MPLPLKRYFYLKELAERWGVSMSDLVDYAWNGELEIAIMTIAQAAEVGRIETGPHEAAPAGHPAEGALDHPSPRQDLEAFLSVETLDHVDDEPSVFA